MARFLVVRVAQLVVTLLIGSVLVFLIVHAAPGDPVVAQLGLNATPERIAAGRHALGLDRPLVIQYLFWLGRAVRLDLGVSFATGLPVTATIGAAFENTLKLTVAAVCLGTILGVVFGVVAAVRYGSRTDKTISSTAAVGMSVPNFAVGTMLILVFAVYLKILPAAGAGIPGQSGSDSLTYLVMPAITLAIPFASVVARYVRLELSDSLISEYAFTSRAMGLSSTTVVLNAWRNAMIPTMTVAGIQAGQLLAGAVVTETVFSYPGLGFLTIQSIDSLNYPVVEGVIIVATAVFIIMMFVVDILAAAIDPRVRVNGRIG